MFAKTYLYVNVFHKRNVTFNMTIMELRLMCLSHQQRRFKKKNNGQTRYVHQVSMMAKTSVLLSVCYRNQAGADCD